MMTVIDMSGSRPCRPSSGKSGLHGRQQMPLPPPRPHTFQVGDLVYVRRHRTQTSEPRWKDPYLVLLTTPTTRKVEGIAAWIHASHVKPATTSDPSDWGVERTEHPFKIKISRTKETQDADDSQNTPDCDGNPDEGQF